MWIILFERLYYSFLIVGFIEESNEDMQWLLMRWLIDKRLNDEIIDDFAWMFAMAAVDP